jgi:hypothetical protein
MPAEVPSAHAVHAAAGTAPPLAAPRQPLPRRRTVANDPPGALRRVLLVAAGVLAVLVAIPATAHAAFFVLLGAVVATAAWLLTGAPRDGDGRLVPTLVAALFATALVVGWLSADGVRRVLLALPWLAVALLLRWGAGTRLPRALLWWPALFVLAAGLLWIALLLTVEYRPASGSQWNVFAGWPWPHYLGAVRGNVPYAERDPGALAASYAVMLGVAAVVLWRRPVPWLVRWLPRFAAALALLHLFGGYRLALATEG